MTTTEAPTYLPAGFAKHRKTRVALVGTGVIAEIHAAVLRSLGDVEVAGVCDTDRVKAERFAKRHGIAATVSNLAELGGAVKPDVAHVLTPPQSHAAVTLELLGLGVSAFVEKPFGLTAAECERIEGEARARGLVVGVNHNFTLHPLFRRLLADVNRGVIGRVERFESFQNNPLRQLTAGDFGNWLFADPGNVFLEQGPHALSQIVALLGIPEDARCTPSGRRDLPGGLAFFDTWEAVLTYPGAVARLTLGFGREFHESWLYAVGQDGAIRADLVTGLYTVHRRTRWPEFWSQTLTNRRDARAAAAAARAACLGYLGALVKLRPRQDPFYVGMRDSIARFHRALRRGGPLPTSAEDGAAVVGLCERLVEPARAEARRRPPPRPAELLEAAGPRPGEVAVIGASGFIGGHVVESLTRQGIPVRALLRHPRVAGDWLRHPLTRYVKGDLSDPAALERCIAGTDAVIHLAAGGGDRYEDVERIIVFGTDAVAQLCLKHRVRRLLYASTVAALYMGDRVKLDDGALPDPRPLRRSHYARAKIESERRLLDLHRRSGLPVVLLRPGVVLGRRGRVQHGGMGQWPSDTECIGWGRGDVPIPSLLVQDLADAIHRALTAPGLEGKALNLAGDVPLTARQYVEALAASTGRPFHFHPKPVASLFAGEVVKWLVKLAVRPEENALPSLRDLKSRAFRARLDTAGAKRVLGWRPETDRAAFLAKALEVLPPAPPTLTTTHVLHVFSTFAPGGTQRRTVDVFHALPERFRHTVLAIDNDWSARKRFLRELPVQFLEVPKDSRGRVLRPELRRLIQREAPDLMITYNWGAMEAIQALAFRSHAPTLHAQDGFGLDEAKGQLTRRLWARRAFLRFCQALVVPSRNLERIGVEDWWLPRRRVLYIANGIDTVKLDGPGGAARARFREEHKIPDGAFTVGMVAHLRREKNPARLVRAFAAGAPPDGVLVFVGEGPERSEIEAAARGLGMLDRVRFAGHIHDPADAYKAFDVFALCSETEQMPISVLEAMAAGTPVVSTDVGDVKTMVAPQNHELVTPLGDDGAMAASIKKLAADPSLRERIGAANRARCVSHYSLEQQNNAYRDLYDRFSRPDPFRSEHYRT